MDPFQLLIKPISSVCNLNCKYCFYTPISEIFKGKPSQVMPDSILEKMIKDYLALGFKENVFIWQGGEPTLAGLEFFKKAIELQQKYAKNQIIGNVLQTNGILINQKWCEFFSYYKFFLGISVDGPEEIHDSSRGMGSHKKVLNAIKLLTKNNVEYNILTVLHSGNANKIIEIYKFLKTLPTKFFQFIPALDNDLKTGKPCNHSISAEDYGKSLCDLFDEWKIEDFDKISIRTFDSIMHGYMGMKSTMCVFSEKCADYIVVENQGDIYPCDFYVRPKYKLGNITKNNFEFLLKKRNRTFVKKKPNYDESCRECQWLNLCYGGCPKDRIFGNNKYPRKSYLCEAYKMLFKYTFHWFYKKAIEIANRDNIQPVFIKNFNSESRCPCGSGKKIGECIKLRN